MITIFRKGVKADMNKLEVHKYKRMTIFFVALIFLQIVPRAASASDSIAFPGPMAGSTYTVEVTGNTGTITEFSGPPNELMGPLYDFAIPATVTKPDNTTVITITGIDYRAFADSYNLRTLTIPDTITSIGDYAFYDCRNLVTVNMPDRMSSIGSHAFGSCSKLPSITIPLGISVINSNLFYHCSSLSTINLPDGVTQIHSGAFRECSSLSTVTLPASVSWIGPGAFKDCTLLSNIIIPSGVTELYEETFKGCRSLVNVTIPNSVTQIGTAAFNECKSLSSITIPDGVTQIGPSAFASTALQSVTIPSKVTILSPGMFRSCKSLTAVSLPNGLLDVGGEAFAGCSSLKQIVLPDSVSSLYINNGIFAYCTSLESVKLPSNYIKIGRDNFLNCTSLRSITIPASVTQLGDSAFAGCSNLSEANFLGNAPSPSNFGSGAFDNCAPGFKIKYLRGKTGWSNPFHSYPAEDVAAFVNDNITATLPENINSHGLENIPASTPPKKPTGGTIELTIDNPLMSSNGLKREIDAGFGTAPIINNGRTFLPIRALIAEMGGTIGWDAKESKVTIQYNGKNVELWIGKNTMRVDGVEKTMEVKPFVSATGRTMLPLKFVGENLGCNVSWDPAARSAKIDYGTAAKDNTTPAVVTPAAAKLPPGVPSTLPAPSIANLELLKYEDGTPYFRLEVAVPTSVLTLDQKRPADGWMNIESDAKIDNGEWGDIGSGGGHLDVYSNDEHAVPGKTNTYYLTFDLEDEGGLGETVIRSRTYSYRVRVHYTYYYGDGPGESDTVYSPWSNELSAQSESYNKVEESE